MEELEAASKKDVWGKWAKREPTLLSIGKQILSIGKHMMSI